MAKKAFSGGEKLEAYLREVATKITNPGTLEVGFPEGGTYPDGTSIPLVAAIQEFGAPARGIPPRPFFRSMIKTESPGWGKALAGLLKAHDYDASKALNLMGEAIAGQLVASIDATTSPPLAPATIARKGFDKPLLDSGVMRNSVKATVK